MTEKSLAMAIVANRLTGEAIATAADRAPYRIETTGRLLAIRYYILIDSL
jgi:hypothetical protein